MQEVVTCQPHEFPGWNLKLASIYGEQGETKDAVYFEFVGGRFNK